MPESSSWDVILGADSTRTVLGIDFRVSWRREADFAEFAAMMGSEYRFLRARPRSVRSGEALSSEACTGSWIESLRRDRQPVLAVLGHGVGSVYAAEIAEAVGRWQQSPAIILFDPELTSAGLLSRAFSAEVNADQAILSADEIERARQAAAEIAGRPGRIAGVAAEVVAAYLETLAIPWERIGLGDVRESEFTRSFESHIAWLVAASQLDPSNAWERSIAIISTDHARMLEPGSSADNASDLVSRRILVDVDHDGLLRSDSVASVVLGLLGSR